MVYAKLITVIRCSLLVKSYTTVVQQFSTMPLMSGILFDKSFTVCKINDGYGYRANTEQGYF